MTKIFPNENHVVENKPSERLDFKKFDPCPDLRLGEMP